MRRLRLHDVVQDRARNFAASKMPLFDQTFNEFAADHACRSEYQDFHQRVSIAFELL